MTALVVHPPSRPLVGSVPVPSDANIGRIALIVGAIAEGPVRLTSFSASDEDRATIEALRALGAKIDVTGGAATIEGRGLRGLAEAPGGVDCGGSAAAMRLLCGVLVGQPFRSTLRGDTRVARRRMGRVVDALRARGAGVEGQPDPEVPGEIVAPLSVEGVVAGQLLGPLELASPTASPDLKGAVLLSGLYAAAVTRFAEPTVSRDHLERLLEALGAPLRSSGPLLELDPTRWDRRLPGFAMAIPGDLSAAAVLVAAAQVIEGSRVTVRGAGTNLSRSGWLEMARDMGAGLAVEPKGEHHGEPLADLHAWSAPLHAASVGGETLARALDEFPLICVLAARASGSARILGAEALDDPEETVAATLAVLEAFGVRCGALRGGIEIEGSAAPLVAADVDSRGDPSIALAAVVLGLASTGPTRVRDAACIAWRYPKFVATLRGLGARIDVQS